MREIIWRAEGDGVLEEIASELRRDRPVEFGLDGVLRSHDDDGYRIGFKAAPPRQVRDIPRRGLNNRAERNAPVRPRTISHVVIHTPDLARSSAFYVDRLGFRTTDEFSDGKGAFLRPEGTPDHHKLFLICMEKPLGLNHVAFEVGHFGEVVSGGEQLVNKGWKSAWGPGRHVLGSNYFWYFESPLGGAMEYTCDLDQLDDDWKPERWALTPENAAMWVFRYDQGGLADLDNVAREPG